MADFSYNKDTQRSHLAIANGVSFHLAYDHRAREISRDYSEQQQTLFAQ